MAEDFFASFAANVTGPAPATAGAGAAAAAAPAVAPPAEAPPASGGIRPWIWVGGLIIIAVILLLYFGL
jgi:hypothetical protein